MLRYDHPQPPWGVFFWGSHPDEGNDDCHSGEYFATKEQALAEYNKEHKDPCVAYIEIDGPTLNECRKNPAYKPSQDDDSDWRREIAMEAGMLGGCDSYNEVMGYD